MYYIDMYVYVGNIFFPQCCENNSQEDRKNSEQKHPQHGAFVLISKSIPKGFWWAKLHFEVLDSQRVACFPPSIPGLQEGRKAGCCRMRY